MAGTFAGTSVDAARVLVTLVVGIFEEFLPHTCTLRCPSPTQPHGLPGTSRHAAATTLPVAQLKGPGKRVVGIGYGSHVVQQRVALLAARAQPAIDGLLEAHAFNATTTVSSVALANSEDFALLTSDTQDDLLRWARTRRPQAEAFTHNVNLALLAGAADQSPLADPLSLVGTMIRRHYCDAGYFHGIVESYDTLDDGTHAYLVSFPSDGDLVHVAVDEVRRSVLSRFDRLCYEERGLHADPVASWTGVSSPGPVVGVKRALPDAPVE